MENHLQKFRNKLDRQKKLESEIEPKFQVVQIQKVTAPIYTIDLNGYIDNRPIQNACLDYITKSNNLQNNHESFKRVLRSWKSKILNRGENNPIPLLEKLFDVVVEKANNIYRNNTLGTDEFDFSLYLDHYWLAAFEKGEYGIEHNHGTAIYAAAYYAKVPENSSPLVISNETGDKTIDVYEGLLVIFPGNTLHSIPVCNNQDKRIVISMNFLRQLIT